MASPSTKIGTSLGIRASAMVAFVAVVVGAAVVVIANRQMAEQAYAEAQMRGRVTLRALSIPVSTALAEQDYPALDNLVTDLVSTGEGGLLVLEVLNGNGRRMASSRTGFFAGGDSAFEPQLVTAALATGEARFFYGPSPAAPEYLDLSMPLLFGHRWGTVIGRFSLTAVQARQAQASWESTFLICGLVILVWLAITLLLRPLILWPLQKLAATAAAIGGGDLTARAKLQRTDEIGVLAGAIDTMAAHLEDHRRLLEQRVAERTRDLQRANSELERLSTTDGLTGLRNARSIHDSVALEVKRARRNPSPSSLCIADLDHFKTYNDTHGHLVGDRLLKEFATVLTATFRETDLIARYGGDEFAVLMIGCDAQNSLETAEKLVTAIRTHRFVGADALPSGRVTVSVGIATFPSQAESAGELFEHADRALNDAKRAGRDRALRYGAQEEDGAATGTDAESADDCDGEPA